MNWLLLAFNLFIFSIAQAQDIFSFGNSVEYISHLQQSGRLADAEREYGFLLKRYPQNTTVTIAYTRLMLEEAKYPAAFTFAKSRSYEFRSNDTFGFYLVKSAFLTDSIGWIRRSAVTLNASNTAAQELSAYCAYRLQTAPDNSTLPPALLSNESVAATRTTRSPVLAGALSALMPGAGKIYSRQWKDGLFSFGGIAIYSYLAWSAFHQAGTGSVFGWVNVSIASLFYLANIAGSVSAAKRYNDLNQKKIESALKSRVAQLEY
jgi:hypothetical protein